MPIISLWKCTTIRQVHYFFQQCHMHNPFIIEYQITCSLISQYHQISPFSDMGMYQYLLIPILVEWTSIYQLFWCSPRVQGFDTLPYYVTSPKIEWSNPKLSEFWRPFFATQGWHSLAGRARHPGGLKNEGLFSLWWSGISWETQPPWWRH